MNKRDALRSEQQGLIGLFGHTYVPDENLAGRKVIQYQFEIVRQMGERYIVQLFSFLDGSPTQVKVMNEAELLGPDVNLYLTQEDWNAAYMKEADRRYYERKQKREDQALNRMLVDSPKQ